MAHAIDKDNQLAFPSQEDEWNVIAIAALKEAFLKQLGVIPFVGAGLSTPWGFPGWTSFLLETGAALACKDVVEGAIDRQDYEEAAEIIQERLGRQKFNTLIRSTFGKKIHFDNPSAKNAAVQLLPLLTKGPVLTTNFDAVLETVFQNQGKPFSLPPIWGSKPTLAGATLVEDYFFLLKIHGDARNDEERVFTKTEYVHHYGSTTKIDFTKPLPQLLLKLFTSRSLLFLGCSLEGDRTMTILKRAAQTKGSPQHFGIVQGPEDDPAREKRKQFLLAHGIMPVFFKKGNYGFINLLLEYIHASIPPHAQKLYGTIPFSHDEDLTEQSDRRVEIAKEEFKNREETLRRLTEGWQSLTTADERSYFLTLHRDFYDRYYPDTLYKLSDIIIDENRITDPSTSAAFLLTKYYAFKKRGQLSEADKSLHEATQLLQNTAPDAIHLDRLHAMAADALEEGDAELAERLIRSALRTAYRIGFSDPFGMRRMYFRRAKILSQFETRFHRATQYMRTYLCRSLWIARKEGAKGDVAEVLTFLAGLYFQSENYRRIIQLSLLSLHYTDDQHENPMQLRSVNCQELAIAYSELGNFSEAVRYYKEALYYEQQSVSDDMENVRLSDILKNIAWLEYTTYFLQDDSDKGIDAVGKAALGKSLDYYDQAWDYARSIPVRRQRARECAIIMVYRSLPRNANGDAAGALHDLEKAIRYLQLKKDREHLQTAWNNYGVIQESNGNWRDAEQAYRKAIGYTSDNDIGPKRMILYNLTLGLKRAGQMKDAQHFAQLLKATYGKNEPIVSDSFNRLLQELLRQGQSFDDAHQPLSS
ncbi:MAG TPA: SIR2 family protein [Flavisolibacter sp.]|nr:SIR2 family protein [Flavisolibacter sp.]